SGASADDVSVDTGEFLLLTGSNVQEVLESADTNTAFAKITIMDGTYPEPPYAVGQAVVTGDNGQVLFFVESAGGNDASAGLTATDTIASWTVDLGAAGVMLSMRDDEGTPKMGFFDTQPVAKPEVEYDSGAD